MANKRALGLHATFFSIYAFGVYYSLKHLYIPVLHDPPKNYAGQWKFLTFWDAVIQTLFYAICVLCDVLGNRFVYLNRFRDYVFATLAFPLGIFVASTFWGLYAIDRNLIFPPILDLYYPRWLNHSMHTMIIPSSFLEMYLWNHEYPERSPAIKCVVFFASLYITWLIYLGVVIGIWVYPIFSILNWLQQILFYGVLILAFVGLYIFGEKVNSKLWGKTPKSKGEKSN